MTDSPEAAAGLTVLDRLTRAYAKPGRVVWIGIRPARRAAIIALSETQIDETGLRGDRRAAAGKRAVTLIEAEHLPVIAALSDCQAIVPSLLRRNLVVEGLNLLGLRKRQFRVGAAVLEGTGLCAPCSRIEEALGRGGYAAVRGHGGITATVVASGAVRIGDRVLPLDS